MGGGGESNRAIEGVRDHWCCVNAFIFTATRQVPNQNKFIIFVGPPTALIHTYAKFQSCFSASTHLLFEIFGIDET